eukprot:TRINITY_DN4925_c0_g1_i1.p1 TRINITY_DN4925_c0_g1~~TRINITY_DN4925_c0_g1_i1.p1  ORF type:complete len:295 (+),score=51.73 TRINITY_DN4925_c0_g1_i1:160-1044(+)
MILFGASLFEWRFSQSQKLVDNYILSAPVFDPTTQQYIGFLDMKDLVSIVVHVAGQKAQHDQIQHVRTLLKSLDSYSYPTEGVTISYLARRRPFHSVLIGSPLIKAVEILERRIHRVAIVDAQGKVVKILSQSAVVKYLSQHMETLGSSIHRELADLKLGIKTVFQVNEQQSALESFKLMEQKNVSGVAVVDKATGRLTGNVSSRDLKKFIHAPSFGLLHSPVSQFLKVLRQEDISDTRQPTVACFANSTFAHAIGLISATRLHHLYVVDNEREYKPVGVISLTDILQTAMHML